RKNTRAIIISHVSNVTGNITDLDLISKICKKHKLLLIVDCAQSAGLIDIDVEKYGIDCLCFTGHKALFALQGIGGIYIREGLEVKPIKVGGAGFSSFDKNHPSKMPDLLEAGTPNGHGILSLNASLDYINSIGLPDIRQKDLDLLTYFSQRLEEIPDIEIFGVKDLTKRVGIVAL